MNIEMEILEAFAWRGNLLVHRKSGKRVKRPRLGYVAFKGRLWKSSFIIAVLLEERRDQRFSVSLTMARTFPDLVVAKAESEALGLTVYRTGRQCKRGHRSWRFVSNGACLACYGKLQQNQPGEDHG